MNKIRGIIFDLDGTLIDSSKHVLASFNYALGPFNITFTHADIERVRSRTRIELFADLPLKNEEIEQALIRLDQFRHQSEHRIDLYPGIKNLLTKLHSIQIPMAIWTGRDTASAQDLAENLGVKSCFKLIKGNCGLKKNKPDPEGLLLVAKHLAIPTNELFMIGDHDHDIEAAKHAHAKSIRVTWGNEFKAQIASDYQFEQVDSLANFLFNYFEGHC